MIAVEHPYVSAGHTDTGKVRRLNEDAILVRDDLGLWVVADGLGGHSAGDFASSLIVERLGALSREGDVADFIESIEDALEQVNHELLLRARSLHVDLIGSTVVVLVYDRDFMLCGWVGDSRAYGMNGGRLRQLTRDHVQGPREDVTQFGNAPSGGGALTRAVGAQETLLIDWIVSETRAGMPFLLCTDGINKEIPDAELDLECRRLDEPDALLRRLFDLALGRAARDNVSAVVVRVQG